MKNIKEFYWSKDYDGTAAAAVTEDGRLYTWGDSSDGQLGNGKTTGIQAEPVEVYLPDSVRVEKLCWSDYHNAAAVTEDGSLYLWGRNIDGQLGNGEGGENAAPRTKPEKVSGLGSVKEFSWVHDGTAAAITEDGVLYMWGANAWGVIGNAASEPVQKTPIKVLEGVREIQYNHQSYVGAVAHIENDYVTVAMCKDGSLWGWGDSQGLSAEPRMLLSAAAADTFCLSGTWKRHNPTPGSYWGTAHFNIAAVTKDGSLYLWGDNTSGQLGNGGREASEACEIVYFYDDPAVPAVSGRTAFAAVAGSSGKTAEFKDLRPNERYNIYILKSRDEEGQSDPENLLFIGQEVSDENGNISAACEMREAYDTPEIFAVGWNRMDLVSSEISVDDVIYDETEHLAEVKVTYDGELLTESRDYEVYGSCAVTEIGEYRITVRGIGLYCGEKEAVFHVKEKDPDVDPGNPDPNPDPGMGDVLPEDVPSDGVIPQGLWIAGIAEEGYAYTGRAVKPDVRVYDHKTLLKQKTDYVISYRNNTKANDASDAAAAPTVTVTGKGNYSGKETVSFRILALDIGGDSFDADDLSVSYNGKARTPVPDLFWNGKKLKHKKDFVITYYDGTGENRMTSVKDEGSYAIELTGIGNFSGNRRICLSITGELKQIGKASVSKIPVQPYHSYSQSGVTSVLTVRDGKETLKEGIHYTVRFSNDTGVGTAYAVLTGKKEGGYSGTKRVSFKISGISIGKTSVTGLSGAAFSYTGEEITPGLQLAVKTGGVSKSLKEGEDYTVTWQKNRNAGTATVLITGMGGYTGTLKKTFRIRAFNIADNADGRFGVTMESREVPYAKGGGKPALKVTFTKTDGTVQSLREGTDYTVVYRNHQSVSTEENADRLPVVSIRGKGNFTGVFKGQELTYRITTQDIGKLTLNAVDKTYQNKKNIYATRVTITDLDGKVLKAGKDYEKALTYTYKNDTRLDNGISRAAGEAVEREDVIPAGTVIVVSAAGKGNYTGTVNGEYRITQANISGAKVTVEKQEYTGKAITLDESQITVKMKGQTLDQDQYRIVQGSYRNNVKKGTASVTIRGVDNYGGTKTVKFSIKAKGFLWWWRK